MFRRLEQISGERVTFSFDGHEVHAVAGETIAAALLAAGIDHFRLSPVSAQPRAAFCMMGACYDCLVAINGENVQACITQVEPGLRVERPDVVTGASDD